MRLADRLAAAGLPLLLLAAALGPPLPAQCTTEWASYGGGPGPNHFVNASATWDPDGPGPAAPRLVLGGLFYTAGNAVTSRIAMYDLQTREFSGMGGAGMTNGAYTEVKALATLPNGDLIAGGDFTLAGSTPVANIARWDGTGWHPLGAGIAGRVHALAVMPNGDLIAGGTFVTAGSASASFVARWDGAAWHPLGGGVDGSVTALCALPNGDVIAGGFFANAGGVPAHWVARWDGTAWSPLGTGLWGSGPDSVKALTVLPNGDLVAGGGFYFFAGGILMSRLARWDGTSWTGFGAGADSTVQALLVRPNGDLLVAGQFRTIDGVPIPGLARWDGVSWSALGAGLGGANVYTLTPLPVGELFAGWNGGWRWDGSTWHPVTTTTGTDGIFSALAARRGGGVIAGGSGTMIQGVPVNNIATYDGSTWSPLGAGTDGPVNAVAELPNGDVIAAGGFSAAGGAAASRVARWDGTAWHPLGAGLAGSSTFGFHAGPCLVHSSGDVIVGGRFMTAGQVTANNIARWDGTAWHALGSGLGFGGQEVVYHLAELPGGDIVAAGSFRAAGGAGVNNLARWDGTAWHPVGPVLVDSSAMIARRTGEIVVGGNRWVGQWDGVAWQTLGSPPNGSVNALAELPNGDLIAGGSFNVSGGVVTPNIARWDGTAWSAIGAVIGGWVASLKLRHDGVLEVGGTFSVAEGLAAAGLAEWRTTCPATATSIATTCAGSTGPVSLAATAMPWTGSTFGSEATGFGPGALAATLIGFSSPNLPLSAWSPLAGPGCLQLTSHEAVALVVPQAGTASWSLAIPDDRSHLGLVLFHQYLQLEPAAPQGALLSGSNALRLSVGGF